MKVWNWDYVSGKSSVCSETPTSDVDRLSADPAFCRHGSQAQGDASQQGGVGSSHVAWELVALCPHGAGRLLLQASGGC